MIGSNIKLTLLKTEHKTGTGAKSNKPYDFYVAHVVDDSYSAFQLSMESKAVSNDILTMQNVAVICEVEFKPKGFDIAGKILKITVQK